MNKKELDAFVRKMRPIEIHYRDGEQQTANFSGSYSVNSSGDMIFHSENFISSSKSFDIYLHDRYGVNYEHRHEFIELQYVYDGDFEQSIDGTDYHMKKGDLCILNTITRHYIKDTDENDIVVNFLFAPAFFDYRFFGNLGSNDLFSDFFMRSIYQSDNIKRYLIFHLDKNERIRQIITDIMLERFFPNLCSDEIIECSLILLFAELMRINHSDKNSVVYNKSGKGKLSDIITYIESNYRTATLKSVASNFGYTPGHLGSLLKESFGKTFTEIHHEIRMMNSAKMLLSTSMPVSEIASSVGFSNLSHFYMLFRRKFSVTPQEYRDQSKGLNEA